MKTKSIEILVCMLLISAMVLPVAGIIEHDIDSKQILGGDEPVVKWTQEPDPAGWDVFATGEPNILADDFECTQSGPITHVTVWGSWMDNFEGNILQFRLFIFSNNPSGQYNHSEPLELLWDWEFEEFNIEEQNKSDQGWFFPRVNEYILNDHDRWFRYDIRISEAIAFPQVEGTIYWLGVYVEVEEPNAMWGWKTAKEQWEDAAVYKDIHDDWRELRDPLDNEKLDLSFEVSTPKGCDAEITSVTGGLLSPRPSIRLIAELLNNGSDPLTDVSWKIDFSNGLFLLGKSSGDIPEIPPGEYVEILSGPVIGLAWPGEVTITVDPGNCGSTTKKKDVYVLAVFLFDP